METPAIQRLIDRAHVANNEPTRIDAKKAQGEIDAMHSRMSRALGDLFIYALQHGEPKEKEAATAAILTADRDRIAAAIREEHDRIRDDGHWYPNDVMHLCARLLRVVEGG